MIRAAAAPILLMILLAGRGLPPNAAASPAADNAQSPQVPERGGGRGGRGAGRVYKAQITPHWFDNGARFWYRNDLAGGERQFVLVDAEAGTRRPAFDHDRLAAALSKAAGTKERADRLPFDEITFVDGGKAVRF